MIGWAVTFLILGIVAMVLGLGGIAEFAVNVAWLLLIVGVVLFVINAITTRRVVVKR